MTHLLDTNVVSEWAKPSPDPFVIAWLAEQNDMAPPLFVATFADLRRGVEGLPECQRRERLNDWSTNDLAPHFAGRTPRIDRRIAEVWGVLAAGVRRSGRTVWPIDILFTATVLVHNLTRVIRNICDFALFDLSIVNP